jgi:glycosyltransferase involved in cell wall biosynthesis
MQARGRYLLFLDADDRLLPCALDKFRDLLSRGDFDFAFGGHLSIGEDGEVNKHLAKPLSRDPHTNFRRFLRKKLGGISHGATLIRKTVFEHFKYPEGIHRNEDIVLYGHLLATSRCLAFPDPVVTIYKHADSLRNNIQTILTTDIRVVDALFNPEILPDKMMRMRSEFLSRYYLTQFRVLHKAGYYREARAFYRLSVGIFPGSLLRLSNLWKYLRGMLRSGS